ncbi:efflux RND transporter periplasmic adaptor subunit [Aeoliella sp.]|uniref:efflux RND transporter periplasmic adaptor subunit n=1 Tax=Aeoliella sp. TaxID=2795800 RepID=UPI003CCC0855
MQALFFIVVGFILALFLRGSSSSDSALTPATTAVSSSGASLWTCSMHPQIRSTSPGKCPICGMDLIPVANTSGGMRTLTISPETRALMNIASAPVERKYVSHDVPMVGKVDYDETKLGYISAWVPGRLDRLYVDYTGIAVNAGDHMVYIYSPELYSAQEELIQAIKYQSEQGRGNRFTPSLDLVESAREKLRLLGLKEEQIREIEQRDQPSDHLTIYSPLSGVVIDKLKQEGDYVKTGERIYTVADLDQVWVHLDAYESDLPWIRYGQDVTITTEAYPGEEFHGRISFIQPVLNDKTRTVKVRVNVPNPTGKLKPEMFVRAVARPQVAAEGRVIDPSLAGKWICPMHPEVVKDEPGTCNICGMDLVQAESLGFVTAETDERVAPLVIPYSAALVTGRRAIVYVELPELPKGVETAYQGISASIQAGDLQQIREANGVFSKVLDRAYGQSGTQYARQTWNTYADELAPFVLAGSRASSIEQAKQAFAGMESVMERVHEQFAPTGQPTFEGREIVLGPRAGNYYLVSHGLQEGELVVTQGNFKIDAEIQIQAKPSMMTPEGGGGGGHHHGGGPTKPAGGDEHAGHQMSLPPEFVAHIQALQDAYQQVTQAVESKNLDQVRLAFSQFGSSLAAVDGSQLSGHARMQWNEFNMLLGNDAFEGQDVKQLDEADQVFLLLKGHMRRMREQLGVQTEQPPATERLAVPEEFQTKLAAAWNHYRAIQRELAADNPQNAQVAAISLQTTINAVDPTGLSPRAVEVWQRERANMSTLTASLGDKSDLKDMRTAFKPLSEEVGVLAKTFGFGDANPVFELHCPMAFQGQGAVWYQEDDQVKNPYYGSSMLTCADRVERVVHDEPTMPGSQRDHQDHSQH